MSDEASRRRLSLSRTPEKNTRTARAQRHERSNETPLVAAQPAHRSRAPSWFQQIATRVAHCDRGMVTSAKALGSQSEQGERTIERLLSASINLPPAGVLALCLSQ